MNSDAREKVAQAMGIYYMPGDIPPGPDQIERGIAAHVEWLWQQSDNPLVMNALMDAVTAIPLGACEARIAYAIRNTLLTALLGERNDDEQ